jgi:hypothetical protein
MEKRNATNELSDNRLCDLGPKKPEGRGLSRIEQAHLRGPSDDTLVPPIGTGNPEFVEEGGNNVSSMSACRVPKRMYTTSLMRAATSISGSDLHCHISGPLKITGQPCCRVSPMPKLVNQSIAAIIQLVPDL